MRKVMVFSIAVATTAALTATPSFARVGDGGKDTLVCKTDSKTGSRVPKRTCRTRNQWEQISEQAKRDAKEMIDKALIETRKGD